jgi:serine/threonine protein kinase
VTCARCGASLAEGSRFCGTCGNATLPTATAAATGATAYAAPAADITGREIAGRYRINIKLGEGGMGAVYRAEQISLKRKVAVKLLKPELSSEPGLVRRFNAEAELAAKLNHPNTVNIYDFGQDADGTLFIAMEYVEGKSLRAVLAAEGAMAPGRALNIVAQIASSLTDAHTHGIVHRDLKPDNVMLTERGKQRDVVRVLDFGIAKLRDDGKGVEQAMTRAGDLVGTPQYMAPEQIRAEAVDGRTDVYAVGAMLYEMLTGRLPFEGPTLMAILSKHLTETPEPPSRRRPELGIPQPLDTLVLETLAKRAEDRTASMERLGERVAEVAAALGSPIALGPMTGPSTAQVPTGTAAGARDPHAPPFPPPMTPATGPAMGPPPGPPPMTPGRPMRPPGVPHTYPPGMMMAPPEPTPAIAPSPYAPPPPGYAPAPGQYSPLPAGTPPPPSHATPAHVHHHTPAPVRRSNALVWVLLALTLAGAGVAVFLLMKGKDAGKTGSGTTTARTTASGDIDPWADGTTVKTTLGATLALPAGFTPEAIPGAQNLPAGVAHYYSGRLDDAQVKVFLIEVPKEAGRDIAGDLTRSVLAEGTKIGDGQQTLASTPWPTWIIAGPDLDDVTMLHMEMLSYEDDRRVIALFVGTTPEHFADTAALRTQIFSKRFHP